MPSQAYWSRLQFDKYVDIKIVCVCTIDSVFVIYASFNITMYTN